MQTVIGAFDDMARAQQARERLLQEGFTQDDVHVEHQGAAGGASLSGGTTTQERSGGGFFARLFGGEDTTYERQAGTYDEAVRRGHALVVVDARDEAQAERAATLLDSLGAMDLDRHARQWQSGQVQGRQQDLLRDDAPPEGKEGVLDVVQEELQVGKRRLDKGGVRVIQRLSEKPVREVVRLREERATVERRAVDRPASPQDLDTFREGTLEVRETTEEPVVAKSARVVEEVRVGKEVREREQTVEDTVRRKDVEVQKMEGGRLSGERERAVASDRSVEPPPLSSQGRDPDADLSPSGGAKGRKSRRDPGGS